MNAVAKPMVITAKYTSSCKACGRQVLPGDRVEWLKGDKHVSHVQCTEGGRTLMLAVAASRASEPKVDGPVIPCPEGLEYRPFQVAGIQTALLFPEGVLLAEEMGLGKSIESAGYANATPEARRILVICPASVKINWQRELEKWLVDRTIRSFDLDLRTGEVSKSFKTGKPEVCLFPLIGDVTVVSYGMLAKVPDYLSWDLLVVDEVQYIKNQRAIRSQHLTAIRARSALVLALTGTPVPNKPIELFPILQLVAPKEWDPPGMAMRKTKDGKKTYVPVGAGGGAGFFKYAKRYCNAHQEWVSKTKQVWVFDGASNLDELNEKLRTTCMVRRLKKDVLAELPPKQRNIICLPSEDDKRFVDAENKTLAAVLKAKNLDEAAKAMSAAKVDFAGYSKARLGTAKAKVGDVVEHVRTVLEGADKVIVFAHHKEVIAELNTQLAPYGAVVVNGDTEHGEAEGERQWAVDRFQTDPGTRVFIGSIGAAGVGLTLTAAQNVVFAELPMRPDELSQAEDRAHRIGQKGSVLIDILVYDGSVDAHIAKMLVAKQDVADMALDKDTIGDISDRPIEAGGLTYAAAKQKAYDDAGLTPKECAELLAKIQYLAGRCDGAVVEDGAGFSKFDAGIGHALAECRSLSPKQALCARKLAVKYRRQLDGRTF